MKQIYSLLLGISFFTTSDAAAAMRPFVTIDGEERLICHIDESRHSILDNGDAERSSFFGVPIQLIDDPEWAPSPLAVEVTPPSLKVTWHKDPTAPKAHYKFSIKAATDSDLFALLIVTDKAGKTQHLPQRIDFSEIEAGSMLDVSLPVNLAGILESPLRTHLIECRLFDKGREVIPLLNGKNPLVVDHSRFAATTDQPLSAILPISVPYPQGSARKIASAKVVVEFIVDTEGLARNVKALDAPHKSFAAEAVYAVENTRFYPVVHNGKRVAVRARLPILFDQTP